MMLPNVQQNVVTGPLAASGLKGGLPGGCAGCHTGSLGGCWKGIPPAAAGCAVMLPTYRPGPKGGFPGGWPANEQYYWAKGQCNGWQYASRQAGGFAGYKGSPPHCWPCGGSCKGGGSCQGPGSGMQSGGSCKGGGSCLGPGSDTVPPPVRTFAAIWNLDPEIYGRGKCTRNAVLWLALIRTDLVPFALEHIPGVAGAFKLEYDDCYSAESAALALDRVAPRHDVLVPREGEDVRAAVFDADWQCFREEDVPIEVLHGMQHCTGDQWRRYPWKRPGLFGSAWRELPGAANAAPLEAASSSWQ